VIDFGVHPFVWTSRWTGDSVPLIERARALGFTAMDIPVRTLDEGGIRATREKLTALGMRVVAVAGIGLPYDFTADDPHIRQQAVAYVQRLVLTAKGIGAELLSGVFYAPVGKLTGQGPQEDELARSAECLRQVARFAAQHGMVLALEPINRYETYLINTVDQGLAMLERINEPNVGLQLDTYHMNIEEKDFYRAFVRAGKHLLHCHVCENDRGIPGSGLVPWRRVFEALKDIKYHGIVSIESFLSCIPDTAATTRVWRQLAPDGDTLAREGLAFLRATAQAVGLSVRTL